MLSTITESTELRPLTADEIDCVAGGQKAYTLCERDERNGQWHFYVVCRSLKRFRLRHSYIN